MARDTALISRRVRSIAASLSLLLCLLAAMTADAADSTSREQGSTALAPIFHRPSNEVERDLNAVLVLNAAGVLKDSRIFDFMTDRNGAAYASDPLGPPSAFGHRFFGPVPSI